MYYISSMGNFQFQEFDICGISSEIPMCATNTCELNYEDFVDD